MHPWVVKSIVVYGLLLAMRHFLHGDAAYYSVGLLMPVVQLMVPVFETLLGYKPTIIFIFEVIASFLCVLLGNYIARRLQTMMNRPVNAASKPASNGFSTGGRHRERNALTQALVVLFVITPAVYYISVYARAQVIGDPHKLLLTSSSSSSSGKVSVDDTTSYISPHAKSMDSHGELVIVEDVSEEEYQRSKSGDATRAKPKSKSADPQPKSVGFPDLQKGQEWPIAVVTKDLFKKPFLIFCGFGIVLSAVSTFLLGKVVGF
jgi:hypothetical protein